MYYETIFIVNPDISQDNAQALTDDLVQRVEKAGGRIVKREYWGARPLAYAIAKRKRGHYILLVTDGEPKAVQALEQALRLEERVMRFLTTTLAEPSEEPSPLLRRQQQRKERESAAAAEAKRAKSESAEAKTAGETPQQDEPTEADAAEQA